jgi:hypothetical protein
MSYLHVKAWRKRVKAMLVQAFGGQCGCCNYSSCVEALEFHHPDPRSKDLGISSWNAAASFRRIGEEASKCVMLCANCHREVHAGVRDIPSSIRRFDESLFSSLKKGAVFEKHKAASAVRKVSAKKRGEWSGVDVVALREAGQSWSGIARSAHVSPGSVKKRYEKQRRMV